MREECKEAYMTLHGACMLSRNDLATAYVKMLAHLLRNRPPVDRRAPIEFFIRQYHNGAGCKSPLINDEVLRNSAMICYTFIHLINRDDKYSFLVLGGQILAMTS